PMMPPSPSCSSRRRSCRAIRRKTRRRKCRRCLRFRRPVDAQQLVCQICLRLEGLIDSACQGLVIVVARANHYPMMTSCKPMQSHEMPAVMRDDSALLADGIGQHIFIRNLQVCLTGLLDGQHIMTKLAQGEG